MIPTRTQGLNCAVQYKILPDCASSLWSLSFSSQPYSEYHACSSFQSIFSMLGFHPQLRPEVSSQLVSYILI